MRSVWFCRPWRGWRASPVQLNVWILRTLRILRATLLSVKADSCPGPKRFPVDDDFFDRVPAKLLHHRIRQHDGDHGFADHRGGWDGADVAALDGRRAFRH